MARSRQSRGLPLLIALCCSASAARADDDLAPLAARLTAVEGNLTASFDVTGAFTETFRKRVIGGLRSVVLIEAVLYNDDDRAVSQVVRQCNLTLDVWDDVLSVKIREANRKAERRFGVIDRGLSECGRVEEIRLGPLAAFQCADPYHMDVRVLLNPVDQETLESAREFMSNPRGNREGRPQTFFGAVAQLFSSKPETGGEQFGFRAPGLYRPRRSP